MLLASVAFVTSIAAVAFVIATDDEGDPPGTESARLHAIKEMPFPAQGPFGRRTTGERVQVVDGSEVLSIVGGPSPPFTVVLRITGEVEAVIDAYATQLGCGPGSEFEHHSSVCSREPHHFELVGLAGGDFYTLRVAEASDGQSWIGLLSYADG